jgi:hypothetical protein
VQASEEGHSAGGGGKGGGGCWGCDSLRRETTTHSGREKRRAVVLRVWVAGALFGTGWQGAILGACQLRKELSDAHP